MGLFASIVCRRLNISSLVGYLFVGAIIGEGYLDWIEDRDHQIQYIAEAGVFLLLFSIGLEFSLDELWKLGRNLIVGGSLQMILVALPVSLLTKYFGVTWQSAILLGSAVAFSSTVIVFKVLSESGNLSLEHGRRALGILLFQDAALIPLLLMIPLLTNTGEASGPSDYLFLFVKSLLFVFGVIIVRSILRKWIIPAFANFKSPDLIVLFTLVSLGAIILAANTIGLPHEIGAFAAGLVFSANRWTKQIEALVLPFREAFSAVFFVSLGLLFNPKLLWAEPIFQFSCFVGLIFLKASAATLALRATGLNWRRSFGMGIGLAHVGEFAFVLVLFGWSSGVISEVNHQRVISLAIGSLMFTPILLKYGLKLAQESKTIEGQDSRKIQLHHIERHAVVVGAGPIGRQVASSLETRGIDVCVIDLSPINLHGFAIEGFRTIEGDATNPLTLDYAQVDEASTVIVCIPDDSAAIQIVREIRKLNNKAFIVVRCRYFSNEPELRKLGANHVVSEEIEVNKAIQKMIFEFQHHKPIDKPTESSHTTITV